MHSHPPHFLITGAGSGIGRAIALRLAARGAAISLLGRTERTLRETEHLAQAAGATQTAVVIADIRNQSQVVQATQQAVDALGPLKGIVANSGIGGPNFPGEQDRFTDLIETNLIGTYTTLRAAQPHLCTGEPTYMVVISSILGRFGVPGYTGYCASKTALLGLVRALALELAGNDVHVNAVCPGWVDTDMAREGLEGMAEGMKVSLDEAKAIAMKAVPMGRMSTPEDIAGLVAWLTSPDARGVTGQGIDMNGGAWM